MSSQLIDLTIRLKLDKAGWFTATIDEVPGAISQGLSEYQACMNVLEARRDLAALSREQSAAAPGDQDSPA